MRSRIASLVRIWYSRIYPHVTNLIRNEDGTRMVKTCITGEYLPFGQASERDTTNVLRRCERHNGTT